MNPELIGAVDQISQKFSDRDPIHNVWDQETYFKEIKSRLKASLSPESLKEIEATGKNLIQASDPYKQKVGIHLLRLCIWQNPEFASEWINNIAPTLLSHEHARIRHSTLWNVRSAIWQDHTLAEEALRFAQDGLNDVDPAVQRVSMWTHGDAVVQDQALYPSASISMKDFLTRNPKESNYLFALEEFYMPLSVTFGTDVDYLDEIRDISQKSEGSPGIKGRCANILENAFDVTQEDRLEIEKRLLESNCSATQKSLVLDGKHNEALTMLTDEFVCADTFMDRMKMVWIIRDLSWLQSSCDVLSFQKLANSLGDTRDGDLIRTTSVVLADNILLHTDALAEVAVDAVEDFYKHSDIDGSQIVVAQILTPLRNYSDYSRATLQRALPGLAERTANKSVNFTLNRLVA